jgi:hypothetical protein
MEPINLTAEQVRAAATHPEGVQLIDPGTNQAYVLLSAEVYAKLRAVVDGITRRSGWDEPALDDYEQYRRKA